MVRRFRFWTKWFALKNNENFHERFLQSNPKFPLVLLTFTKGFLNGKLQFLQQSRLILTLQKELSQTKRYN